MYKSHGPILIGASCWRVRKIAVANSVRPFLRAPWGWMPLLSLLVAAVFGSMSAVAQNNIGCAPNTANYPCVYVANGGGSDYVSVINATTKSVITTVTVGTSPQDLAITHACAHLNGEPQ
jgi:YVTN family beta-propeller protein